MAIPKAIANFTTSLAIKMTSSASSFTLTASTDPDGTTLSGTFYVIIDEGTSTEEHFIVSLAGAAATVTTRGVSKVDAKTNKAANQFAHDRGAEVKITDIALIRVINRLNGDEAFDSPAWTGVASIAGLSTPTSGETTKAANVAFVNAVAIAGAPDATVAVKGIVTVSTAPVSPTAPIAVGDNDTRVPTQDENNALVGTSGTPSTSNKFVTNDDTSTTAAVSKVVRYKSDSKIDDAAISLTTAGDIVYSDGTDLQRLALGTVTGQVLGFSGSAPAWTYPQFSNGIGLATVAKTYWTCGYPLIDDTFAAASAGTVTYGGTYITFNHSSGASILTAKAIFRTNAGTTDDGNLYFGTGKDIIVEMGCILSAVPAADQGFGLANAGTCMTDYDSAADSCVMFSISAAGALYGKTSNGGGTTDHTETLITGVTLTNLNTYRIEFNPGVDAKFYVNGVLKATITTTLPNGTAADDVVKFGIGVAGEAKTVCNLQIAVEK